MEFITPVFLGSVIMAVIITVWVMVAYDGRKRKKTPPKKHVSLPWWLDLIWVLLLSMVFLLVAYVIRILVGLPAQTHHAGYPWIGYTLCWGAFVIMAHNGQRYSTYFPLSGIAVLIISIATFLLL